MKNKEWRMQTSEVWVTYFLLFTSGAALMEMFLLFWESWPVFVTALVTLGVTVYAFLPSQKSPTAAMIYQVVTVMSFILALPAVLINARLGLELFPIADPSVQIAILWLNLLGGLVALLSFLLSILAVGQMNLPPAGQQFVNAPLGSQHKIPTPPSSHSIAQPAPPSVRFTGPISHVTSHATSHTAQNLTDQATSHVAENLTDHAPSTSIDSYQVSTLDDSVSPPYTEFSRFSQSAAPTPVRPVTNMTQNEKQNEKQDETILLRQGSQAVKSPFFAWLVALNGSHRGQPYALTRHRNTIGRASNADMVLTDKAVSAQHAALKRDDEQHLFMLHDLKSANGTYLHGQLITSPQPLKDKDRIRVGETDFHFMEVRLDELLAEQKPQHEPPAGVGAEETVVLT